MTGDFRHRRSWFWKTVSKVEFFLNADQESIGSCTVLSFFVWTEEKGGFEMSYIILITAHALWGMLSYIHYLLFKNFRVDKPKRFQSATCGCVFFFNRKRRKRIIFFKNIRYIWTESQTRDAWFYSTGLVKENTDVPQTLPIMICTYPGVPYKIARLIHNWAPLIKLDQRMRCGVHQE